MTRPTPRSGAPPADRQHGQTIDALQASRTLRSPSGDGKSVTVEGRLTTGAADLEGIADRAPNARSRRACCSSDKPGGGRCRARASRQWCAAERGDLSRMVYRRPPPLRTGRRGSLTRAEFASRSAKHAACCSTTPCAVPPLHCSICDRGCRAAAWRRPSRTFPDAGRCSGERRKCEFLERVASRTRVAGTAKEQVTDWGRAAGRRSSADAGGVVVAGPPSGRGRRPQVGLPRAHPGSRRNALAAVEVAGFLVIRARPDSARLPRLAPASPRNARRPEALLKRVCGIRRAA
jgi:hypothetical protein